MGLSDEERKRKIAYAIKGIVEISKEGLEIINKDKWSDPYNAKTVFKKGIKLWRTIFNKSGDSAYWILGSDEGVAFSKTTLLSIALYDNIIEKQNDLWKNKKDPDDINYDYFSKRLSLMGFLPSVPQKIYEIYLWCQQLQYAVNRYQDDLAKSYNPLMNQISDILGLIFGLFTKEHDFAKSWLWVEICNHLYKKGWLYRKQSEQDDITKLLIEENIHHNFSIDRFIVDELRNILKSLTVDGSDKNRLKWIIDLAGDKIFKRDNLKNLCKKYKYPWMVALKKIKKLEEKNSKKEQHYAEDYNKTEKCNREDLLGIEHSYDD